MELHEVSSDRTVDRVREAPRRAEQSLVSEAYESLASLSKQQQVGRHSSTVADDVFGRLTIVDTPTTPSSSTGARDSQGASPAQLPRDSSSSTGDAHTLPDRPANGTTSSGQHPSDYASGGQCLAGDPASANLTSEDMLRLFERNQSRLDTNHDGFVSSSELDRALGDRCITGQDAQLVATLRRNQSQLEELSNDEWGDENDGITLNDLRSFDAMARNHHRESRTVNNISTYGESQFTTLDSDRNGFISGAEINRALQNQSLNATDRETLTAMRSRIGNIEEASNDEWFDENDGITRADLAQYGRQPGNSEEGRLVRRADRSLERSGASLSAANQNLFAHPDNPLEDIRPDAVSQGWTRDCLFMSTLASVANSNPQLIRNMIHDNGNRTYTVTFPGDRQHPVTVSAPTDSELAAFARGSERGLWPAVMERAYGAWRNNNGVIQENTSDRLWINVTQLLTGESSTRSHMWHMSHARIQEILANANRSPVVVGMDSEYFASIGISDNIDDATGLRRGHAYSVLGYDARTRTVTLRNPWGHGEPRDASGRPRDGIDDGVFTMSYDEFYGRFNAIIRTGN